MREIVNELKEHLKSDFNIVAYTYVILFVFTALTLNYITGFYQILIQHYYGRPLGYLIYPLYYFVAYYFTLIPVLLIRKKTHLLRSTEFWVKSIVFLIVIGVAHNYYEYSKFAQRIGENAFEVSYIRNTLGYLKRFLPYVFILIIIKLIFDRKEKGFYGIRLIGLNYKPYFYILLLLIPLVTIASFLPNFQIYYPRLKFWIFTESFDLSVFKLSVIYELAYGLDFISVELFFRGALVVGMAKVLGKEAILAMAATYCFIHFGKPVGEAISSFFGGYILGVIALNHKNINGGIIVHLGIAFMMEIAAIIQYFIRI